MKQGKEQTMPRVLEELPEPRLGRPPKYPYDKWLDGKVWLLVEGEDFEVGAARSVAMGLRAAARKRGQKAKTRTVRGLAVEATLPEGGRES
jgi:hypothetical protein